MMLQEVKQEVTLTIPMVPDMELAATKTASAIGQMVHLDSNKIDEIKIALIEACLNSFEHSKSSDRKVYITFQLLPSVLRIIIRDHGHGFDPHKIEEPDIQTKLHHSHKRGWGFKIMSGLMDAVSITTDREGTTIVLEKKIDAQQGASHE